MPENTLPLVCICIPAYNAEKTIAKTLQSVLGQSYTNLVVHVLDNQSSDRTASIVEGFDDPRLTLHRNPVNLGGEGNFNRCIEIATGKYMAMYHADDIYEPEMVTTQVKFLEEHPRAGAVFTEAKLIDEDGRVIGAINTPASLPAATDGLYNFSTVFKAVIENSNFFICPSVMAHTPVYQNDIRRWRNELFGDGADLDVWLRIAQLHPLGIIRKPLMRYRLGSTQWSAKVRMSTDKGTIFSVLDHYLEAPDVRALMTTRDRENYSRLERRDRVGRAVNLFVTGESEKALALCHDIWSRTALKAALHTRRGLLVLALGTYLKLLKFFGWQKIGEVSLLYMKRVTNK